MGTYDAIIKGEYADISTMVDVVTPHDWIRMVLHPDASKGITTDLTIFVGSLNCHRQHPPIHHKSQGCKRFSPLCFYHTT